LKHFLRYHPTISSHFPPALNPFTHYKRRGTIFFSVRSWGPDDTFQRRGENTTLLLTDTFSNQPL
jgi:hypothetical protein